MLSRIPPQVQQALAVALPVVCLIIAYFLVVPRYQALKRDEAELDTTVKTVTYKAALIQTAEVRGKIPPVKATIPDSLNEKPQFLRDLDTLIKQTRVTRGALSETTPPQPPAGADGSASAQLPVDTVPVALQVNVTGSFEHLARFFWRLETYPRLLSVSNVSMSGKDDQLTANFILTRYTGSVPENNAAAPATQ